MNERIRELAVKSFDVELDRRNFEEFSTDSYGIEKFAKLILEEAMAIVRDEVAYQGEWGLADDVVKKVNEHFGVDYE